MPLEVRQIGIRMSLADEKEPAAAGGDAAPEQCPGKLSHAEREAIVEQCVRQLLDTLRMGRER